MFTASLFSPEDFFFPELITGALFPWEILPLVIGKLDTYTHEGVQGELESGVYLKNPEAITVASGAYVESGAYLTGPCIIGPFTEVRHGAYVRGGVITGSRCVIGHCTEIKNSYLAHGVKASHFAYIGDSVLGAEVNLGAGVRCANLRLDQRPVIMKSGDRVFETHCKKVGAFIGRGTSIGCNVVLNPGTCIPAYTQLKSPWSTPKN